MTLVILAAGLGARFGGAGKKQIVTVGPNNEVVCDYSVYDAFNVGFTKALFVINKANEKEFCQMVIDPIARRHNVDYAFQDNMGRKVPWGTGHAVLCAADKINENFAVINADDFYGRNTFLSLAGFLKTAQPRRHSMAGFLLKNTVSEHGAVSRGICRFKDNYLISIDETHNIRRDETGVYTDTQDGKRLYLDSNLTVSMSAWGFHLSAPEIFKQGFDFFYRENKDSIKAEYYLPSAVSLMIREGHSVKVIPAAERWYGITYKEDVPVISRAINEMIKNGVYPDKLWE